MTTLVRGVVGTSAVLVLVLGVFAAYLLWLNSPERPDWRIPIALSALVVAIALTIWRRRTRAPTGLLVAFVLTIAVLIVWGFMQRSA
jgi:hypothetical protein